VISVGKCQYCNCWWIDGNKENHLINCPHDKIDEIKYRFKIGAITEQVMNDLINGVLDR
jgi:hypothetical protein